MRSSAERSQKNSQKKSLIKKSVQISTTLKVSSTFSKVAGFQRAEPLARPPQRAKSLYFKKTEQGVRNAKAFRGEAYKTASPFYIPKQTYPPKRSGGTFWTKQFLRAFCTACTSIISFSSDCACPEKGQAIFIPLIFSAICCII